MVPLHHPAPSSPQFPLKPLLAGGVMFALFGLVFDFHGMKAWVPQPSRASASGESCEAIVQADSTLSREELAQVLTIPERDTKERIRAIVSEPYCELPDLKVRAGVVAKREAYPLEFDPKTHLVILYENDEYAGYRFSFE